MARGGEARHVGPDLGDHHAATVALTPGIVIRRSMARRKGQGVAQARLHVAHGKLERIDLAKWSLNKKR